MDAFKSSETGEKLAWEIHSLLGKLKESLTLDGMDYMSSMKDPLDRKMTHLVRRYEQYGELHKLVEYIRNDLGSWFTCPPYKEMVAANNLAEQNIKELWS